MARAMTATTSQKEGVALKKGGHRQAGSARESRPTQATGEVKR